MTPVFVDTVGFIALWDRNDQWHVAATHAASELAKRRVRLFTTTAVLLECGNAAARLPYRSAVVDSRQAFTERGDLLDPNEAEQELAWQAYNRGEAGEAGIVDHLSFQVMRRLGATEAFTNDRHFTAAGFVTLF
jgi:predicted nucleic acid-binding protein